MAFTEDLDLFFEPTEFGDTALLTPAGGGDGTPGNVIFDLDGLILDQYEVQSAGPSALFTAEQWPDAREGDHLAIQFAAGRKFFKVRAVTPQRDGAISLLALVRTTGFDTSAGTFYLGNDAVMFKADYLAYASGSAFLVGWGFLNTDALLVGADRMVLS